MSPAAARNNLSLVPLASPTSGPERIEQAAAAALNPIPGMVYVVSLLGTTGMRDQEASEVKKARLAECTFRPQVLPRGAWERPADEGDAGSEEVHERLYPTIEAQVAARRKLEDKHLSTERAQWPRWMSAASPRALSSRRLCSRCANIRIDLN